MKEKIKCKKCGLQIDSDSKTCPYCGYDQDTPEENLKEEKVNEEKVSLSSINFHREGGAFSLSIKRHLILILLTVFGLTLLATATSLILKATGIIEPKLSALTTLIAYPIFMVAILVSLWEDFIPVCKTLLNWKGLLYGVVATGILIGFNYLYTYLVSLGNIPQSDNQNAAESVVLMYPAAAVIVLSLCGPICEELMYRLGIYGLLRKKNFWLALCVSSVIFGLIHFNIGAESKEAFINELINLPNYIISGAILCLAYEFGGLTASLTAHILNNFIGTLLILLA